jgi:hypothetical protein
MDMRVRAPIRIACLDGAESKRSAILMQRSSHRNPGYISSKAAASIDFFRMNSPPRQVS